MEILKMSVSIAIILLAVIFSTSAFTGNFFSFIEYIPFAKFKCLCIIYSGISDFLQNGNTPNLLQQARDSASNRLNPLANRVAQSRDEVSSFVQNAPSMVGGNPLGNAIAHGLNNHYINRKTTTRNPDLHRRTTTRRPFNRQTTTRRSFNGRTTTRQPRQKKTNKQSRISH